MAANYTLHAEKPCPIVKSDGAAVVSLMKFCATPLALKMDSINGWHPVLEGDATMPTLQDFNATLPDLTVKLSDGTNVSTIVCVNRALLSRQSPYFTTLLTGGFSETDSEEIELHDDYPEASLAMLREFYGMPLYDPHSSPSGKPLLWYAPVYIVAEKYDVQKLKAHARRHLRRFLDTKGNKPDITQTVREIVTQTPKHCEVQDMVLDHCLKHFERLSSRKDFMEMLNDCGEVGAAMLVRKMDWSRSAFDDYDAKHLTRMFIPCHDCSPCDDSQFWNCENPKLR